MLMMGNDNATRYVRRIRNKAKRAYASHVYSAMVHDAELPDSTPFHLSAMAAQAVRMNLAELLKT